MQPTAVEVVLGFVELINLGDAEAVATAMTDDFEFIDMAGDIDVGRKRWDYFERFPDYRIHVDQVLTSGQGVALIGRTTGSHLSAEVEERETVLWTAQVQGSLIASWRIYTSVSQV